MAESGDVALPDAGGADGPHGVGVGVPAVETADDGDSVGVGRPDGEADPAGREVGAQESMGAAVLADVEEVDVQFGDRAGVFRRLLLTGGLDDGRFCFISMVERPCI
jgi:hypothetical protein